ncbi:ABC transporter ATP-binding protein [Cellulomonas chengniuliangii]|uniref:ABC transporter ATP-binding protein n=1 Tax=Cellulomonas chengniuliangii TaxID=2968084 RepID=A0ABY5L224_9CELL|nr:ABC transporter ATP-binding protein [Cellulomonas chengniuliangii]MCC2307214.1 ABC transporter ATP-binding protein [Cellulomonas chengniuliangii]MCC2317890.1 ABC transporter ATP-binding protein [Cellulomonas chengniuliangii]UUI75990.1 ABC transporter ATP-binding protein [Cellulomonas chengniuliangii]
MTSTDTRSAGSTGPSDTQRGLVLADVTLTVGDGDSTITALDHVSMTVSPGELVAVVGPSGSGKSSLLAVAGALTTPDSGTVLIDGQDLGAMKDRERTRFRLEHIGFVFQSGNLVPALTAEDQLRLALHMRGGKPARDPRELLDEVGLSSKLGRRPHELSGGERQRIGIARALVCGPSLLLVDEPTSALDRARSQEIVELLARETRQSGVATVMVTHDHDILLHCDRVLEMIDGTLSAGSRPSA